MEKTELIKILAEKYNQISAIEDEIKDLQIKFAEENTTLKKGDKLNSTTFNNNSIILECLGIFDYTLQSDVIFVDCEVVTSDSERVKLGTIYSIPEKYLTKI
jgi:hypothetical protein